MLKGIDINQRIEFSTSNDLTEPRTVFVFKILTGLEMTDLSQFVSNKEFKITGKQIIDLLNNAIVEIKNPYIKDKKQIEDFLKLQNIVTLTDLVGKVMEINNLGETERKN